MRASAAEDIPATTLLQSLGVLLEIRVMAAALALVPGMGV